LEAAALVAAGGIVASHMKTKNPSGTGALKLRPPVPFSWRKEKEGIDNPP